MVDRDIVEIHNLHRVALYTEGDVGRPKAEALAEALLRLDPGAEVEPRVAHLDPGLARKLVGRADLVVDGLDNMETRYPLHDACLKHGIPWIYTAVLGTAGMMMAIVPGRGPCLRCLFPSPPLPEAPTTAVTFPGSISISPFLITYRWITRSRTPKASRASRTGAERSSRVSSLA